MSYSPVSFSADLGPSVPISLERLVRQTKYCTPSSTLSWPTLCWPFYYHVAQDIGDLVVAPAHRTETKVCILSIGFTVRQQIPIDYTPRKSTISCPIPTRNVVRVFISRKALRIGKRKSGRPASKKHQKRTKSLDQLGKRKTICQSK